MPPSLKLSINLGPLKNREGKYIVSTVAINELLCMKNVGAQIAMDYNCNEDLAPMTIEKIKILGATS